MSKELEKAAKEAAADVFLRHAARELAHKLAHVVPSVPDVRDAIRVVREAMFIWEEIFKGVAEDDSISGDPDAQPPTPAP